MEWGKKWRVSAKNKHSHTISKKMTKTDAMKEAHKKLERGYSVNVFESK